jgi:hypothetical protein
LWQAHRAAVRGKRGSAAVTRWEYRLGEHLLALQARLASGAWQPGRYTRFTIHRPKTRVVSAAPFADRVVHHAWMQVCGPAFERCFSSWSFANRKGMGTHAAVRHVERLAQRHTWALRLDVVQHFQSIDHAVLLGKLERRVADARLLAVAERILAGGEEAMPLTDGPLYLPGDDLLVSVRPRGLPIGNLTSQFWSHVVMDELDQFATRTLGCRAYARYVDDMVLLADDPQTLLTWRDALVQRARERLRLRFHAHSAHPFPVAQGIPWLGMVVEPFTTRIKARKVVSATRHLRQSWRDWMADGLAFDAMDARFKGWIAHARHAQASAVSAAVLRRVCSG